MRNFLDECVVYDVETKRMQYDVPGGWDNPFGMGFASAVLYDYQDDRYHFYLGESGRRQLIRMLDARLAVSFNGVMFDSKVVGGNSRFVGSDGCTMSFSADDAEVDIDIVNFHNFDIMLRYLQARFGVGDIEEIAAMMKSRSVGKGGVFNLAGLAKGTLGKSKCGEGAMAPQLFKARRFTELLEYNLQDVRLTRQLFEHIMDKGFIRDGDGREVKILKVVKEFDARKNA